VVLAASAATFIAGIVVVYWGLGRAGASSGARVGVTIGYGVLALLTLLALAVAVAAAFNR